MKRIASLLIGIVAVGSAMAQSAEATKVDVNKGDILKNGWFNHMDIAFTVGTDGLGFDLAAPMTDWARLRMGGSFMPALTYNMNFSMEVGKETDSQAEKDRRFNKMADLMRDFTGRRPENTVDMTGDPTMNHFKLLVDIFPFKNNRHWHATVGFYYGSGAIAEAYNTTESMNNLVTVGMYNAMYKRALGNEPLIQYGDISIYDERVSAKFKEFGPITIPLGEFRQDIYADRDIYWDHTEMNGMDIIHQKGDIRWHKGDLMYKAGDKYRMTPDEDNMVRAKAQANKFKPYLGVGYSTSISNDKRTQLSVDAGMLFWGGAPKITTRNPIGTDAFGSVVYQEVDLVHDLKDVPGKVGTYVDFLDNLGVYPMLNIRISHRIF